MIDCGDGGEGLELSDVFPTLSKALILEAGKKTGCIVLAILIGKGGWND